MIPLGPVGGFKISNGDPVLVVALDSHPYRCLCLDTAGNFEWLDLEGVQITGWTYEPTAEIWVTEGEALYQAAEQEEVSGEALD